jgi:hypothetical protein
MEETIGDIPSLEHHLQHCTGWTLTEYLHAGGQPRGDGVGSKWWKPELWGCEARDDSSGLFPHDKKFGHNDGIFQNLQAYRLGLSWLCCCFAQPPQGIGLAVLSKDASSATSCLRQSRHVAQHCQGKKAAAKCVSKGSTPRCDLQIGNQRNSSLVGDTGEQCLAIHNLRGTMRSRWVSNKEGLNPKGPGFVFSTTRPSRSIR